MPTKAVKQILWEQSPEAVAERAAIDAQIRRENEARRRALFSKDAPPPNGYVFQPVKLGRID